MCVGVSACWCVSVCRCVGVDLVSCAGLSPRLSGFLLGLDFVLFYSILSYREEWCGYEAAMKGWIQNFFPPKDLFWCWLKCSGEQSVWKLNILPKVFEDRHKTVPPHTDLIRIDTALVGWFEDLWIFFRSDEECFGTCFYIFFILRKPSHHLTTLW